MSFIPFAATVGSWLGGSAAAGGAAILSTAAVATSTGLSIASMQKPKAANIPLPQVPPAMRATSAIQEEEKRKLQGRRSTLLTSSQGVLEPAQVKRKVLLGE